MSQPWFADTGTGYTRQPRRAGRSSYVLPHRRTQPNITVTIPRCGGVAPHRSDPFDISEKFDELDVGPTAEEETYRDSSYEDVPVEAEGEDIPASATSFEEMGFSAKALTDNIRRCKYVKPTPIQSHAIPAAMAGRDLMACAQTGSGKTAAFCFPIINGILVDKRRSKMRSPGSFGSGATAFPVALILAPTRELSCQIHDEAKKFSNQTGVKVVVAYGGAPIFQQLQNLGKGVDILVATPGRLVDLIERAKVSLKNVKYLAMDEADRMLDMGFERQVRRIVQQLDMPPPGARQTMLFSATFPDEIKRLASDFLSSYIFLAAGKVGSSTNLIVQKVEFVPDMQKRNYLLNLLFSQSTTNAPAKDALTLIFVETKKGADALERWLSRKGYPSTAIHGDKVQFERERALRSFRSGHTPILVATDVAARGLDIPHVAHVINFDLPRVIDDYVHRIGRTGRAGKSGMATAFFSEKNLPIAKPLVELMQEASQQVPSWLTEYAQRPCDDNRSSHYGGHAYRYRNDGFLDFNIDDYSSQCGSAMAPYADPFSVSSTAAPAHGDLYGASFGGAATLKLPYVADSYGPVTPGGWDY
ncbi:P-loop containing nucleoside triphosphate hydrolases superfamily protein [Perilla frutescens var. hirtella]|uniref:RNA helicase n=1 Tax=Perilla frutescens var. hirtella TaxID=608512 RepID=A0AAD4JPZ5_PERFH|nr:P-loop containing nucleoside triphosphate hydrolases superfamily protein [Perilla frutescens var. hirtella]